MFSGREFSRQSDSFYYAYITKNHLNDSVELRTAFNRGFYLGAQYAVRTSGELSPHVARFIEFTMWLTERSEDD